MRKYYEGFKKEKNNEKGRKRVSSIGVLTV